MGNLIVVIWCIGAAGILLSGLARAGQAERWPSWRDIVEAVACAVGWPLLLAALLAWAPLAWWRNRLAAPRGRLGR